MSKKRSKARGRGRATSHGDSIIVPVTMRNAQSLATGVSSVLNLDPITIGGPAATEAGIRRFYKIVRIQWSTMPIGQPSAQFDYITAFVPSQLETTPTAQSTTSLMTYRHNTFLSGAETVKQTCSLNEAQLDELCQFPRGKYVCEPSTAANSSEEIQAQLAFAHTNSGTLSIVNKLKIWYRFYDLIANTVNPEEIRARQLARSMQEMQQTTDLALKNAMLALHQLKLTQHKALDKQVQKGELCMNERGDYTYNECRREGCPNCFPPSLTTK